MIGMIFLAAAAAQGPVMLASHNEAQWRLFVRASVQGPPPASRVRGVSRLKQLQGVVHRLGDDEVRREATIDGPQGL